MLAFRDRVTSRQLHILDVPPCDSLNRRVKPERLSDAHGGEGEAGQVLPDHQSTHKYIYHTHKYYLPAISIYIW